MAVQGQWGVGNFRLPDFGITERLGIGQANPAVQQYQPPQPQPIAGPQSFPNMSVPGQYNPVSRSYNAPLPGQTLGASYSASTPQTSNGGFNMSMYPGWNEAAARADYAATGGQGKGIQDQQDALNSQIESEYNNAMSQLSGQESSLRGQAGTAEAQISNESAKTRTALGEERATRQQGVQSQLSTAEQQGTSALQQARDLFRQTQQQNIAQLSALGLSSSSVAEALAERLGVETARRIAGVTGSLQEVQQNASKELARINDYYAQKMTQLQTDEQLQKQQIQQSLLAGLNQINSARNKAASDKAAARQNLMSQVQNSIAQLAQQKQQFEQSLQQWAAQKQAALQPIAQDPNYLNTRVSTANTFNQQFNPQGFAFTPEVSYDKYSTMTGKITSQKKPEQDLLSQYGVQ